MYTLKISQTTIKWSDIYKTGYFLKNWSNDCTFLLIIFRSFIMRMHFVFSKNLVLFNPFTSIIYVENQKLFQRAPSPSDFPLLIYFWIYFTCSCDTRDSLFGSLVTHYGRERVKRIWSCLKRIR